MTDAPIHVVCGSCGRDRTAAMTSTATSSPCACGSTGVRTEALVGTPAPLEHGTAAHESRKPAA